MQDSLCAGNSAEAPVFTQSLQDDESMPPISDDIKAFIVRSLATFDTPSEVVDSVKNNFGVELSRQHVYGYDPECSKPPAQRWCELHAATRAAFLGETAEIGITHKAYRLQLLDRMVHFAMKHHYPGRAQALLEQAAKECGGLYDRERRQRASSKVQMPNVSSTPAKAPHRQTRKISPMAIVAESS
jgi:hypothetical protein